MELSREDIELIDRFNANELSGNELDSFNKRMQDPEFAASVAQHNDATRIIRSAGRAELRKEFAAIHSGIEATGGFEKYKPRKPNKGGGSGGWFAGIGFCILVAASYFYFSGKIKMEDFKNLIKEEGVDTVYHYNYHVDTVYRTHTDTIQTLVTDTVLPDNLKEFKNTSTRKIIRIDTVYKVTKSK
jgi:hypothetical protein